MTFRDLFDIDPRSKKDLRRELELRDESVSALRREAQEQALKGKRMLESHAKDLSGLAASVQASKDRELEALRSLAEAKRALEEAQLELAVNKEHVSGLQREAEEQRLQSKRMLDSHAEALGEMIDKIQKSHDREQEALRSLAEAKRALGEAQREIKQLKSGTADELWVLKEKLEQAERIASEREFEVRNLNLRMHDVAKFSRGASFEAHREIRVEFVVTGEFGFNFENRSYPISSEVVALEKLIQEPIRFIELFEFRSAFENILWRQSQDSLVRIGNLKILDIDGERSETLSMHAKLRLSMDLVANEKFDLSILRDAIAAASNKLFFVVGGFTNGAVFELLFRSEFSLEFMERDM